jgi:hypothetical protein
MDYGLGSLHSPADNRDWTIDVLYAAVGAVPPAVAPAAYTCPAPFAPVINQGTTSRCVAFSNSAEQTYFDLRDQGLIDFDEALFFQRIGGVEGVGAVPRRAFAERLATGYPVVGNAAAAGKHKIAAYYAVPVVQADIQAALMSFGPLVLSVVWYDSWFNPVGGVLRALDTVAGGHAILCIGWNATGLLLQNSWGATWGLAGHCILPWAYLTEVREAWKAVDVIEPKPAAGWTLHIATGATIKQAIFSTSGCISDWKKPDIIWNKPAASVPCEAPAIKKGCSSGQATVAKVLSGTFKGQSIRVGTGVTVTPR